MKNATLIKDYPAIAIWARKPTNVALFAGVEEVMAIEIKYEELMYCENYGAFNPFDLYSYSVANNKCPVKEVERANRLGHRVYMMISHGTCISNTPEAKKHAVAIDLDAIYYYCGKLFKITKLPNRNYGLVEIEQSIELK